MPTGAFNICCPRDCVSRHNGGTSGAPLKPLRDDSALRALSTLGFFLSVSASSGNFSGRSAIHKKFFFEVRHGGEFCRALNTGFQGTNMIHALQYHQYHYSTIALVYALYRAIDIKVGRSPRGKMSSPSQTCCRSHTSQGSSPRGS